MSSVRDRLAAARTAAREDDRNGVQRRSGASIGQNEAAGTSPRHTAVNETTQRGNEAADVRDRLASAREQARKADSTAQAAAANRSPAAEKPDSTHAAEQSNADRLSALREEKGRLEAGLDLDGAARVQDEISKLENDMGISFWQRVWNTAKGGVKSAAEEITDSSRALYEAGQSARSARDRETMAEYSGSLERAKRDMSVMLGENVQSPGTWSERDIQSQQNIIDDWQRKYDAMARVTGEQVQQKATQAAAQLADQTQESAQQDIEKAKEGLGTAGRLLVDAGVAGTQMMGDAAANIVAPGAGLASMAYRAFGSGAQRARQNGATLAQQLGYGAATAGVEILSEKLFDGLAGIYGGGAADDIVEGIIRKMAKTENGQMALRVLASGAGEAAEEIISGAISPALESIYDGKNPLSHYSLDTVQEILYDAAVGGILGGFGGAVSVATGKYNPGGGTETAQKAAPEAAGTRTAQRTGVDMAQTGTAAEANTGGNGQAAQAASGDVLLDAIVRSMQPVTNRQAEALLADPASSALLGIDTNGMTKAQQRAAVKDRVEQMQRELPGEQAYDPANDTLLQAVTGGISTRQDVENQNGFDTKPDGEYNKTGRSKEASDAMARLNSGEAVDLDAIHRIPEIMMAEQRNQEEPTINRPNRKTIQDNGYEQAMKQGSFDGSGYNGPVRQERRMDIVIGLPGSGKSSVYTERISREHGSRVIDTDDYRAYIPEYDGINAGVVHDEASEIKHRVLNSALNSGENIILSTIGYNAQSLAKNIRRYAELGYSVYLHLNELPNSKSMARAIGRFIGEDGKLGRFVSPDLIFQYGDKPTQTYLILTGQGGNIYGENLDGAVPGGRGTGGAEIAGDARPFGGGKAGAAEGLAGWDWYNNDVAYGQPPRLIQSSEQSASGTVGAAAIGFETPGSRSTERTSNLDTGAAAYTMQEGEATSRTREEYDALFRYRTQTEEQSMQAANNMLYLMVDGQPAFLMDFDPESYRAITDSLRQAPAWNGVMTDAAMLIKRELMGRSIDGTVSEDVYTEWLTTMREHATETGRGTQAWSKWTRRDNSAGQSSELEAWENLQNSNLSEEERTQRFQDIVRFDRSIEAAQTDADLRQIILDIARQRGTLSGLTGKQSRLLNSLAESSLDGMSFEQLRQFAYSSSAALSTDAIPANFGAKLKTIQVLNMLSNPKTAAKNLTGNTTFYGLDAMTMRGAALLDMALSKITGTRSVAMESSIFGDRQARADMAKAIRMSIAEVTMDVDMGDSQNRYQQSGNRTFKAGGTGVLGTNTAMDRFAERVLSAFERNMGYLMTTTDEAYKGMARSTQRGTQALVDQGKIKNAGADYAQNKADSLARYRTFQNSGTVATAIQTVHDVLNLVGIGDSGRTLGSGRNAKTVHSFGLGDLVAPFTRVAGNLASVGVDYSPVNAVKGTVEILDTIRNAAMGGNVDPTKQAKAVSDFARGMSGTAIAYGVMLLAQAGIVKRAEDEEDEDVASLNRSEGMVGTQVNIDAAKRMLEGGDGSWQTGDTLMDMSNLEPINFIVSLGVELADNGTDGFLSTFGDVNAYKDTVTSAANAAGDLPILSGVGDFAKDVLVYHNDPLVSAIEMLGKTAISSVTPNAMAAMAKGLDDKQRSTYSGDGTGDVLLDTLKSRVPGLRETLPTTVNTLGQEVENPGGQTQRILNAMLNPLGVNRYNQSEVSREMERVRKATGETGFYPTARKPGSLSYTDKDGKVHEVELDYEQKQKFQAVCGAAQMSVTADMIGSSLYKNAGSDRQAALLDRCYDYAYQYAKAGVLGQDAADQWVRNAQRARQDLGISTTDFLYYYEKYGGGVMSSSGYEKTKRMVSAGLTIDQWAGFRDKVDADGNGSVKKEEVTSYIEANFPAGQWSRIFEAYKGNSNWKNPY